MDQRDSVCITGVGLTSSIGHGYEEFTSNLLAGCSGIERVSAFEVTDHPSQIASLIGQIPCPAGFDETQFRSRLRIEQCGIWCVESALQNAGWHQRPEGLRIGLVLGMGAEWMQSWEMDYRRGGRRAFDPTEEPAGLTTKIHRLMNLQGPQLTISAACASGNWGDFSRKTLAGSGMGGYLHCRCLRHWSDTTVTGGIRKSASIVA